MCFCEAGKRLDTIRNTLFTVSISQRIYGWYPSLVQAQCTRDGHHLTNTKSWNNFYHSSFYVAIFLPGENILSKLLNGKYLKPPELYGQKPYKLKHIFWRWKFFPQLFWTIWVMPNNTSKNLWVGSLCSNSTALNGLLFWLVLYMKHLVPLTVCQFYKAPSASDSFRFNQI